ncbi:MAG: peptide deformylase [Pseudomonadales bacterium]|nr:peptide deformylase [Pseudomonadales bacterium]
MKEIIIIPHPTLRKEARLVTHVDKKLKSFISELEKTLNSKRNPRGVGLAAPQVDKLWRIFTINIDKIQSYINPRIVKKSNQLTFGPDENDPILEGCLSMPELYGPIPRHTWVDIEYQYIDGDKFSEKKVRLENFYARVFQHEIDHLDGILFTDYSLEYNLPVYKELSNNKYEEIDPTLLELF